MQFSKRHWGLFLLILISVIPLFDLFRPGLPLTHDGQDHLARIANFYQSLSEGNIVPRWAGNLNWGYGHPILMFLYPLPSYLASLFHFFGFTITDSLKIVFALTYIASGIAIYLWVRNISDEFSGLITGIGYMFAPYRFVDLYVRGAIGEHTAFVFLPLVLYFLFKLSKKYSYWHLIGGTLSLTGLILSHNALSLMFLPFIILYGLYLVLGNKNKQLTFQYAVILVLGFGLSSFFLIPAFFEGKYTLRDIVTAGTYSSHFVDFNRFFDTSWRYGGSLELSVQIGSVHLIGILISPLVLFQLFKKKKIELSIVYLSLIIYFLVSMFLMLRESDFIYHIISIIQKFQFPWRFMSAVVFSTSVILGFVTLIIPKKTIKFAVCIILIFALVIISRDYFHPRDYLNKDDIFFKTIYNGTTDTGESSPIWSVRFMETLPNNKIEVIEGSASINEISRNSTQHVYSIDITTDKTRLRENTLYFPGWNIYINNSKLPIDQIEFQDPKNRGIMTFYLDKGVYDVIIKFEDTKLRTMSNYLTILSLITLIFIQKIIRFRKYSKE